MGRRAKAERNYEIYARRQAGERFKLIAVCFGLTVQRCQQIYEAEKLRRNQPPDTGGFTGYLGRGS